MFQCFSCRKLLHIICLTKYPRGNSTTKSSDIKVFLNYDFKVNIPARCEITVSSQQVRKWWIDLRSFVIKKSHDFVSSSLSSLLRRASVEDDVLPV